MPKILRALLCISFGVMILIGLLMAYGLVPKIRGSQGLEVSGWDDYDAGDPWAFLARVFFGLATINLLLVWGWLIHCAARHDFLRLFAGILVGAAIIGALLFLTPSHCSHAHHAETSVILNIPHDLTTGLPVLSWDD
ncbi:MAG TPA: hypothetical protein VIT00_13890 [Terrimicrobiaceae bacterium]